MPKTEQDISMEHTIENTLVSPVYSKAAMFSMVLSFIGLLDLIIFTLLSLQSNFDGCLIGSSIGFFAGIISMILGIKGVRDIKRKPYVLKGFKKAVLGIIYGAVDIVVAIMLICFWPFSLF